MTVQEYREWLTKKGGGKKAKTKNKSPADKQLEEALQQHRIEILQNRTGCKVVAEHRFHPGRKWRFDFFFPEIRLAVEVEGGVWLSGGGRHNRGKGFLADCEKYNTAQAMGIQVLRFTPDQLLTEDAIQIINNTIQFILCHK